MKNRRVILLGSVILSFLLTIPAYLKIDGAIPIHYDATFKVDQYGPKEYLFLFALIPLAICFIRPKQLTRNVHYIVRNIIIYFLIAIQWVTIAVALNGSLQTEIMIPFIMGGVLVGAGNYMTVVKRNFWIGFRTPWSVRSDLSWRKTNRYGAFLMVAEGFLLMLYAVLQLKWLAIFITASTTVGIILCIIFSYVWYKEEKKL